MVFYMYIYAYMCMYIYMYKFRDDSTGKYDGINASEAEGFARIKIAFSKYSSTQYKAIQ